jgi:hypothetical protein
VLAVRMGAGVELTTSKRSLTPVLDSDTCMCPASASLSDGNTVPLILVSIPSMHRVVQPIWRIA